MIIHINDIHLKNQQPFLDGNREYFKWLIKNYKNETLVVGGDFYDTSNPFADNENEFIGYLKQFKKVFINSGNHDKSRRAGNSLLHLNHHDNITVFSEKTEVVIEGLKCLFLPYIYNMKEQYETIEWTGNYCFVHGENIEDSFGGVGLKLSNIKAKQIFSHIHMKKQYDDRHVPGVALPSRNGEINNSILTIDSTGINYIDHPIWFDFQDINYGEFPENKNNILNVKNCPSYASVWEMYKGYYVRREGIEVLRTVDESNTEVADFESANIVEKWIAYAKDQSISKEISDCAVQYLQEVI
jgi:hypothetical protein